MPIISPSSPLVLGSASPRRRDLIHGLGIPFIVVTAEVDERRFAGESPNDYLSRVTRDKLTAVQARLAAEPRPHAAVLVADTVVILDGDVLGKPRDVDEAALLVGSLVGRTHRVKTRFSIAKKGELRPVVERTVGSDVTMRAASEREVWRYAVTGEGLDKAGAYAVQGIGAFLVQRIEGSWSNVVGLPVCEVVTELVGARLLDEFP